MGKPRIIQHSFGAPGSGGPIGALHRVLKSDMGEKYDFLQVHQPYAAGGVNLKLVVTMARQMRDFQPDLAHVRGLGNEGFHGVLAAKLAGVPRILVSVHGSVGDLVNGASGIRHWVVRRVLEPLTLRLASHVVTVCEAALEKPIIQACSYKIAGTIPNGVDPMNIPLDQREATRQSLGVEPRDIALIIVARLVMDKGHLDLLNALDSVKRPENSRIHLLVVGDGPDKDKIAERGSLVPGVTIHMLGRRQDVPELLGASDIALLPSWHENLSNALLEAMASGIPTVATDVGGNTEVLLGGGGILVPVNDPSALANAVQELVDDDVKRLEVGLEARRVIESRFTVPHMTKRLAEVYDSILS